MCPYKKGSIILNNCFEDRLRILNLPSLYYRRARGDMTETWKYLHGQYHVNQMPLQRHLVNIHHRKRTLYEAEEREVSQAPAKKLLQTSSAEPLEHADRTC